MTHAEFAVEEHVGTITIDRPEALNAIDLDTKAEMVATLEEWRDDDDVRAVCFESAGDAFSVGGDLKEVEELDFALQPFTKSWRELFETMVTLGKPTVAKVDGYTMGGGFDLVLHTDLVIAGENARFAQPELKLGILNHFSPALLPGTVGIKKTLELMMTGDPITATEAAECGLITKAVPAAELDGVVDSYLESLVAKPPGVMAELKDAIYTSADMAPTAARDHVESRALRQAREEGWMREGVEAQLEDRDPEWAP